MQINKYCWIELLVLDINIWNASKKQKQKQTKQNELLVWTILETT